MHDDKVPSKKGTIIEGDWPRPQLNEHGILVRGGRGEPMTYEEVKKANEEAFVHFALHDFRVLVETRGLDFVMDKMDEETYRKLESWFDFARGWQSGPTG